MFCLDPHRLVSPFAFQWILSFLSGLCPDEFIWVCCSKIEDKTAIAQGGGGGEGAGTFPGF